VPSYFLFIYKNHALVHMNHMNKTEEDLSFCHVYKFSAMNNCIVTSMKSSWAYHVFLWTWSHMYAAEVQVVVLMQGRGVLVLGSLTAQAHLLLYVPRPRLLLHAVARYVLSYAFLFAIFLLLCICSSWEWIPAIKFLDKITIARYVCSHVNYLFGKRIIIYVLKATDFVKILERKIHCNFLDVTEAWMDSRCYNISTDG
jgi:hypothetical protein